MTPRIVLIGTGGTIAATAGGPHALTDYTVTEGIDAMVAAVPGADAIADIHCEQLFNVDSRAMGTREVLQLSRRVAEHLRDPAVKGVVIAHGTDSLEETAFFLHLTLRSAKPVVLVGAMRPGSALSADGPLNLYNALLAAGDPACRNCGVLLVMNDGIFSARHIAKSHTLRVDAFAESGPGVLGGVSNGQVHLHYRPVSGDFPILAVTAPPTGGQAPNASDRPCDGAASGSAHSGRADVLPAVDIILDYQDAPPHPYRAAVDAGTRGIVVAGMGNGSLSPAAHEGCALARERGIVCVRASRVPKGPVTEKSADAAEGLLAAHGLNALQARIALRLALSQGWEPPEIDRYLRSI